MNEPERESDGQEQQDRKRAPGKARFAVASDESEREEPRDFHRADAGKPTPGHGFDRLTQLLACTLDRRGLGGLVTGALVTLNLAADASGKKRKKKKKAKRPIGCPNGCPPAHICTRGICVPGCTTGRPCGAQCCINNELCVDEQCVVPCNDGRLRCNGMCCGPTEICNENDECDDALSGNFIKNGDAESGAASPNGRTQVAIPDWTISTGGTNVMAYGNTTGGWPKPDDPGPEERGRQFFTGGYHRLSEATQTVNLAMFAAQIDTGRIGFELSGFLGGYASHGDNTKLAAVFLNANGDELGQGAIGPVTVAERNRKTGLLFRSATGDVPVGTRQVTLILTMTRSAGLSNDGYADNLSLVLRVT